MGLIRVAIRPALFKLLQDFRTTIDNLSVLGINFGFIAGDTDVVAAAAIDSQHI